MVASLQDDLIELAASENAFESYFAEWEYFSRFPVAN